MYEDYPEQSCNYEPPIYAPYEEETTQIDDKPGFYTFDFAIDLHNIDIKDKDNPAVISLNLAHDLTFLVQTSVRKLRHYTSTGVLIYEFQFEKIIKFLFMADSKTVIIYLQNFVANIGATDEIAQLNLETHQIITTPFRSQFKQISGFQVFIQSKMFCLKESMTIGKTLYQSTVIKKLKLSYFKYPLKTQTSDQIEQKPVYVTYFNTQYQKINTKIKLMRLNNRSMMGIIKQESFKDCSTMVFICNPQENAQKWKKYIFQFPLKPKAKTCHFQIGNIWQIQPSLLYVQIHTEPDQSLLGQKTYKPLYKLTDQELQKMQSSFSFIWNPSKKQPGKLINMGGTSPHFIHFYGQFLALEFVSKAKYYIYKRIEQKSSFFVDYNYWEDQMQLDEIKYDNLVRQLPQKGSIRINYAHFDNKSLAATEVNETSTVKQYIQQDSPTLPPIKKLVSVPYNMTKFLEYHEQYNELDKKRTLFVKLKILKQLKDSVKIIVASMLEELIDDCDDDLMYYAACLVNDNHENDIFHHQID